MKRDRSGLTGVKICNLGSGSSGNATFLQVDGISLLIDNGFSIRELTRRMRERALNPESVDYILVSHAHRDHFDGVGRWGRKFGTPVFTTREATFRYGKLLNKNEICYYMPGEVFGINGISVHAIPVSHDIEPTVGFIIEGKDNKIAIFTDMGYVPEELGDLIKDVNLLFIESNHDIEMLINGPYPPDLQERILSDRGHLSNSATAEFIKTTRFSGDLKYLFLGHLSRENNDPILVREIFEEVIEFHPEIEPELVITNQFEPTDVYTL